MGAILKTFHSFIPSWHDHWLNSRLDEHSLIKLHFSVPDEAADQEATESLVGCAENLMSAVRQTVRESEGVGVKIRSDMVHGVKFVRRDYPR